MPKTALQTLRFAVQTHTIKVATMWGMIVLGNVFAFSVPYFFKLIADYAAATPLEAFSYDAVYWPLIGLVGVFLGQELFFRIAHVIETYLIIGVFDRVTSFLYGNLLNRPSSYFEDRLTGELGRRVEQIGDSVVYFLDRLPWEIGWVFFSVIASAVLLGIAHVQLLIVLLIWLVFFSVTSYILLRYQYHYSYITTDAHARLSGGIIDALGNISLVHSFAGHEEETRRYRDAIGGVLRGEFKERWVSVLNKLQQGLSIAVLGIALIGVSIVLFADGAITIGDFVLVATTIPTLTGMVWNVGEVVMQMVRQYGNLSSAVADLQTDVEQLPEGERMLDATSGDIVFSGITFRYPGTSDDVFTDFDLTIRYGERVGIVGTSGAGKSTLIKLLLRQYDPSAGSITIADNDIREVTLESLRIQIAFVPQDTTLFHRSLYENIQYAQPGAPKEAVHAASARAHADEFIEACPQSYATLVGERGVKLSGGQRQRIAVARAMLKDAPILVLDEATSSLDSESEEIVQRGLHELFAGRTVIAIAHRLSTLKEMDRIVVLKDGAVVEDGAPSELLKRKHSIFKQMWEHQQDGFIV